MKKKQHINSDDKRYEQFVRDLKLVALGIISSSSQLDRSAYAKIHEGKRNPVRRVAARHKLERVSPDFFEASGAFKLTIQDREAKVTGLVIECVFETHVHGGKPIDKALAKRFTASDLPVIMWPFFRQFVFDMTARMSIPPIMLPLEPWE